MDGSPGFSNEIFTALQRRAYSEKEKRNGPIYCSLMLDEMSIRAQQEWDGKRSHSYIDFGTELDMGDDNDTLPLANYALAIMAVSLDNSWKAPLGYFLTNGLTGKENANIVRMSLQRLYDIGYRSAGRVLNM